MPSVEDHDQDYEIHKRALEFDTSKILDVSIQKQFALDIQEKIIQSAKTLFEYYAKVRISRREAINTLGILQIYGEIISIVDEAEMLITSHKVSSCLHDIQDSNLSDTGQLLEKLKTELNAELDQLFNSPKYFFSLEIQINGRLDQTIHGVSTRSSEHEICKLALDITELGASLRSIFYIPGHLVNFVTDEAIKQEEQSNRIDNIDDFIDKLIKRGEHPLDKEDETSTITPTMGEADRGKQQLPVEERGKRLWSAIEPLVRLAEGQGGQIPRIYPEGVGFLEAFFNTDKSINQLARESNGLWSVEGVRKSIHTTLRRVWDYLPPQERQDFPSAEAAIKEVAESATKEAARRAKIQQGQNNALMSDAATERWRRYREERAASSDFPDQSTTNISPRRPAEE